MAKPSNSSTQIGFVAEVTAGTIVATPAWKRLRVTGESLKVNQTFEESDELDPNDGLADIIPVSRSASGGVKFEMTDDTFDDIFANLFAAPWTSDVLVNDKIPTTISIEKKFETGASDMFARFSGCRIPKLTLDMKATKKITGTFDVIGMNADFANAIVAGATYVAPNTETVMTAQRDFTLFSMSGLTIDCIPELTMEISRDLEPLWCMNGSLNAFDIGEGNFRAGGEIVFYADFAKYAVLRAVIDNTLTSLQFTLGTTTLKKTKFEFPVVKFSDVEVVSESKNGSVMIKCKWTALRTTNTTPVTLLPWTARITRNIV